MRTKFNRGKTRLFAGAILKIDLRHKTNNSNEIKKGNLVNTIHKCSKPKASKFYRRFSQCVNTG
jgi:hypothetical protein